jgi:hypothetical protein
MSVEKLLNKGWQLFRSIDLDESEEQVKGSPGRVGGFSATNTRTDGPVYVKFYNATAANVTVGTTTPKITKLIPTQGDSNGSGREENWGIRGVEFDTAITVACTTGRADNDTGAPGAGECICHVKYE